MHALLLLAAPLALLPGAALASETVTYTYDAKGRLTDVHHAGGPTAGAASAYRYDAADNRSHGSASGNGPATTVNSSPVVVVPLNGLQVIPIAPDI